MDRNDSDDSTGKDSAWKALARAIYVGDGETSIVPLAVRQKSRRKRKRNSARLRSVKASRRKSVEWIEKRLVIDGHVYCADKPLLCAGDDCRACRNSPFYGKK